MTQLNQTIEGTKSLTTLGFRLKEILSHKDVSEDTKEAIKLIIFEASSEANFDVAAPENVAHTLPLIFNSLDVNYGRGVFSSINSILSHALPDHVNSEVESKLKSTNENSEFPTVWEYAENYPIEDWETRRILAVLKHEDVPEKAKQLVRALLTDAANTAGLGITSDELIPLSIPLIFFYLNKTYASGIKDSILVLLEEEIPDDLLEEIRRATKKPNFSEVKSIVSETPPIIQTEEAAPKPAPKYDKTKIMGTQETEELLRKLLSEACWEPWALYGLIFFFMSLEECVEQGDEVFLSDLCDVILHFLYCETGGPGQAIKKLSENISTVYRKSDFSIGNEVEQSQPFIDATFDGQKLKVVS